MLPHAVKPNMRVKVVAGKYFGCKGVTRTQVSLLKPPTVLAIPVDLDDGRCRVHVVPGHLESENPD